LEDILNKKLLGLGLIPSTFLSFFNLIIFFNSLLISFFFFFN